MVLTGKKQKLRGKVRKEFPGGMVTLYLVFSTSFFLGTFTWHVSQVAVSGTRDCTAGHVVLGSFNRQVKGWFSYSVFCGIYIYMFFFPEISS